MAPDSTMLIGLPPGPSLSMIAGILLFGADLEERLAELLAFRDVDRLHSVGEVHLFERDRDLAAVGGIPGPQFDAHRRWSPIRNRGRWPAALPRWPAVASRNRLAGDEPNGRAGMG